MCNGLSGFAANNDPGRTISIRLERSVSAGNASNGIFAPGGTTTVYRPHPARNGRRGLSQNGVSVIRSCVDEAADGNASLHILGLITNLGAYLAAVAYVAGCPAVRDLPTASRGFRAGFALACGPLREWSLSARIGRPADTTSRSAHPK